MQRKKCNYYIEQNRIYMVNTRRSNNQAQQAAQALLSLRNSGNRANQGANAGSSNNNLPRAFVANQGRNSSWFQELMKFNANQNNFCIPKRGTPDYNKIMAEVRKRVPARRSRRNSAPAGASSSGQARNSRRASAPPAPAGPPPVPAGPSSSGASSRPQRQRNPVNRYKNR